MHAVILACTTLTEYVKKAQERCGTAYPIVELDRKYHDDPADMRRHILQVLSQLEEDVDTVLAAMGFCGGSWQDVTCSKTLVIPRTADCVALAMTTPERYSPDLKQPGHMYLFGDGKSGRAGKIAGSHGTAENTSSISDGAVPVGTGHATV